MKQFFQQWINQAHYQLFSRLKGCFLGIKGKKQGRKQGLVLSILLKAGLSEKSVKAFWQSKIFRSDSNIFQKNVEGYLLSSQVRDGAGQPCCKSVLTFFFPGLLNFLQVPQATGLTLD